MAKTQSKRKGYLIDIPVLQGYMCDQIDAHSHYANWTHLQSKDFIRKITMKRSVHLFAETHDKSQYMKSDIQVPEGTTLINYPFLEVVGTQPDHQNDSNQVLGPKSNLKAKPIPLKIQSELQSRSVFVKQKIYDWFINCLVGVHLCNMSELLTFLEQLEANLVPQSPRSGSILLP